MHLKRADIERMGVYSGMDYRKQQEERSCGAVIAGNGCPLDRVQ